MQPLVRRLSTAAVVLQVANMATITPGARGRLADSANTAATKDAASGVPVSGCLGGWQ